MKQATNLALERQKEENANNGNTAATLNNYYAMVKTTVNFVTELSANAPAAAKTMIDQAIKGGSNGDLVFGIPAGLTNGIIIGLQESFTAIVTRILRGKIQCHFLYSVCCVFIVISVCII